MKRWALKETRENNKDTSWFLIRASILHILHIKYLLKKYKSRSNLSLETEAKPSMEY